MNFHVCVPIDRALEELHKGNNLFTGTPLEAFHDLMDAKEKGHTFYTGCENVTKEGRCAGHEKTIEAKAFALHKLWTLTP